MDNLTDEQKEKLTEMLDTWDTLHSGLKLVALIGRFIKFAIGIGTALAVLWAYIIHSSPK